jgi:hypothetical protein
VSAEVKEGALSLPAGLPAKVKDLGMTVFAQMGGVGTIEDVSSHVFASLSETERRALTIQGVNKLVGDRFRQTGSDGLPEAPAVDVRGTHMQLELLSAEEFRFVIRECLIGSRRLRRRAEQYRDRCADQHGVEWDLADIEAGIAV